MDYLFQMRIPLFGELLFLFGEILNTAKNTYCTYDTHLVFSTFVGDDFTAILLTDFPDQN